MFPDWVCDFTGICISVQGIYKDGEIILLGPFKPIGSFKVIVTFLESAESDPTREMIQDIQHPAIRKGLQYKVGSILDMSKREMDILILVAKGKTNNEISDELELGNGTVRNYISGLLDKLMVDNRTQLTIKAKELGLVD
jgi:DNA-binding NarL/FixJ family response regulator